MAAVKFKKKLTFKKTGLCSDTYRVARVDRRIVNLMFSWSISNLLMQNNNSGTRVGLLFTFSGAMFWPVNFERKSLSNFFFWNVFILQNYSLRPLTVFYSRIPALKCKKSKMYIKYDSAFSSIRGWLGESLVNDGAYTRGDDLVVSPSYPGYFRFFETWFFLNESRSLDFLLTPTFRAQYWVAAFTPTLDFSLRAVFTLFSNFRSFYPFFLKSVKFRGLGYKFGKAVQGTAFFGGRVNYVDRSPYEGREEFNFSINAPNKVCVRGAVPVSREFFKNSCLMLEPGLAEPELGDYVNPLIPDYFYFNEVDFSRSNVVVENAVDARGQLFSENRISLLLFRLNRWLRVWLLNFQSSIFSNLRISRIVKFNGVWSRNQLFAKAWVVQWALTAKLYLTLQELETVASNYLNTSPNTSYSYNNLFRPFFVAFVLSRTIANRWLNYIILLFGENFFCKMFRFYLIYIRGCWSYTFFFKKIYKAAVFSRIFLLFIYTAKFFNKTLYHFVKMLFTSMGTYSLASFFMRTGILCVVSLVVCLLVYLLRLNVILALVGVFCLLVFTFFGTRLLFLNGTFDSGYDLSNRSEYARVNSSSFVEKKFTQHLWPTLRIWSKKFCIFALSYRIWYLICVVAGNRFTKLYNVLVSWRLAVNRASSRKVTHSAGAYVSLWDWTFIYCHLRGEWRNNYKYLYLNSETLFWNIFNSGRYLYGGYGWWFSCFTVGLNRYPLFIHLNRLTSVSVQSIQYKAFTLGLTSVYAGFSGDKLNSLFCLGVDLTLQVFLKFVLSGLLCTANNEFFGLNSGLLHAILFTKRILSQQFFVKLNSLRQKDYLGRGAKFFKEMRVTVFWGLVGLLFFLLKTGVLLLLYTLRTVVATMRVILCAGLLLCALLLSGLITTYYLNFFWLPTTYLCLKLLFLYFLIFI